MTEPYTPKATQPLSRYASHPAASKGRLHAEPESASRSPFQRDRDRILHSTAFRRLEYKTQVFVNHEGDHYRTRLTHSLEVSQLARSMCRSLRLNEDLAEALALAHDLGHTPFGHAGEDALREAMEPFGGFDHNAHTLRLVTSLEQRYAAFDGLNLTWETLEGIAKHNGPLVKRSPAASILKKLMHKPRPASLPRAIAEYDVKHKLELENYAGAEAQIASLADDIAYNNHDIDDGLRAGLITLEQISAVDGVGAIFREVRTLYPNIAEPRLIHEAIRRMISRMVSDLVAQTGRNIQNNPIETVEDIRRLGKPLASFSPEMQEINKNLQDFLREYMYRHYKVNRMASKARRVVKELFHFFLNEPECLPNGWRELANGPKTAKTAGVVADYLAGMTDRFALDEYSRVFDVQTRSWLGK